MVGGGAAGSALALLLARRGVGVTLVDDGRAHHSGPHETVLAATRGAFERLGLLDDVDDGVQRDPLRHGAIWGSAALAWRDDPEAGLLLERGAFDRALRRAAARAGAAVHERTRAERHGRSWRIGDAAIEPAVVAFATGRRRAPAERAPDIGETPRTIAVTVRGTPDARDRGTAVVEAVADGWLWTHAPQVGDATVAVMLDADGGSGDSSLRARVDALLAAASGPASRLRDLRVLRANDATPRVRAAHGDELRLGDAAGTIDPLASQGVEKAVAAAEHAAVAIATALEQPSWWPRLRRQHERWERELWLVHQRTTAEFYAREPRFADRPFWQRRRAGPAPAPLDPRAELCWRPELEPGGALLRHGDRFVEVPGLRDRRSGYEFARIGRVPAAALHALTRPTTTLDAAVAAAGRDPGLVTLSPRDVHDALHWLLDQGLLVSERPSAPAGR